MSYEIDNIYYDEDTDRFIARINSKPYSFRYNDIRSVIGRYPIVVIKFPILRPTNEASKNRKNTSSVTLGVSLDSLKARYPNAYNAIVTAIMEVPQNAIIRPNNVSMVAQPNSIGGLKKKKPATKKKKPSTKKKPVTKKKPSTKKKTSTKKKKPVTKKKKTSIKKKKTSNKRK